MIVFYHCYGSAHSSVLAAYIHLGVLRKDRRPRCGEICCVPHYDNLPDALVGTPLFCGADNHNVKIYALGLRGAGSVSVRMLLALLHELRVDEIVVFVDTLHLINVLVRVGGFFSRQLGWVRVGRVMTSIGLWLTYPKFVALVKHVRAYLKLMQGDLLDSGGKVTDNEE